jgi:hypothetical protein
MAELNLGTLIDVVGKVIESQSNQQQGSVNNTNSSPQSTTADAGQSAEDINNSGPLALAPPSRSLERTLKLAPIEEISCGYHHFAVKTKNGDISFYQIDEDGFLQPVLNLSLKPEPNKMNFLFNENDEFYKTN